MKAPLFDNNIHVNKNNNSLITVLAHRSTQCLPAGPTLPSRRGTTTSRSPSRANRKASTTYPHLSSPSPPRARSHITTSHRTWSLRLISRTQTPTAMKAFTMCHHLPFIQGRGLATTCTTSRGSCRPPSTEARPPTETAAKASTTSPLRMLAQ